MPSSAPAACFHTATLTGVPKSFSAPTPRVFRTRFPKDALFINAAMKLVFNAFVHHVTHPDPDLTKTYGLPTKKPSPPSRKPPPTHPSTGLVPTSLHMLKDSPTSSPPPSTTNHFPTPSKISPPTVLIKNLSTPTSPKKTHTYSHSSGDYLRSSPSLCSTGLLRAVPQVCHS